MSDLTWTCSGCEADLHLSGTLWRDSEDNPFCAAAPNDPVAEQYAAYGIKAQAPVTRMHQPGCNWIHPALREAKSSVETAL